MTTAAGLQPWRSGIAAMPSMRVDGNPMAEGDRYAEAARGIEDDLGYDELAPRRSDHVIAAAQHKGDHQSMLRALRSPAPFIALIAIRKRSGLVLDYLRREGADETAICAGKAPTKLRVRACTPGRGSISASRRRRRARCRW